MDLRGMIFAWHNQSSIGFGRHYDRNAGEILFIKQRFTFFLTFVNLMLLFINSGSQVSLLDIIWTVLHAIHCKRLGNEIMNVLINVMQSRDIYIWNYMIYTRNTLHITFLPLNGKQTLQLIAYNAWSFERHDTISDMGNQRVLTE